MRRNATSPILGGGNDDFSPSRLDAVYPRHEWAQSTELTDWDELARTAHEGPLYLWLLRGFTTPSKPFFCGRPKSVTIQPQTDQVSYIGLYF